jgi:hypothetical protein
MPPPAAIMVDFTGPACKKGWIVAGKGKGYAVDLDFEAEKGA